MKGIKSRLKVLDKEIGKCSFEEYEDISNQMHDLIDLKNKQRLFDKINPNVIITTAGTLVLAAAIMKFEEENVFTSKAFGFISKLIGR